MKISQMINQALVQRLSKILQNMLQHYIRTHWLHRSSITNEKPKLYQVNDINTLIHNVTHTSHPDITELIPQTNYSFQDIFDSVPTLLFSLHQIYVTNSDTPLMTSHIYIVQPTSHTSKPQVFPSIPYTTEYPKFINKYNFQFSDLTDTEIITL